MSDAFLPPSRQKIEETIQKRLTECGNYFCSIQATPDIVLGTGHTGDLRSSPEIAIYAPQDIGIDEMIDRLQTFLQHLVNERDRLKAEVFTQMPSGLFVPSPGLGG